VTAVPADGVAPPVDYRAVFAATATPYLVLAPDLVVLDVNPAFERLCSRARDELVGQPVHLVFPEVASWGDHARSLGDALIAPTTVPQSRERRAASVIRIELAGDGSGEVVTRYLQPMTSAIAGEDGTVLGLLHRVDDLTQAEGELQRRYREALDEIEQLRSALTSRATIDQAKGIVMAQRGCDADEAFAVLVRTSQDRNIKVRDLAATIVARRTLD
jgi:hypothetical protein